MAEIPEEMVRLAAAGISLILPAFIPAEQEADLARAALEAAGVAQTFSAFDGLAEQCQTLRRDLAEATKERERLVTCEAELIRQTGCNPDEIAGIYQVPPVPVTNARCRESYQRGRATGRARLDALVEEIEDISDHFNSGIESWPYEDCRIRVEKAIRDLCGEEV